MRMGSRNEYEAFIRTRSQSRLPRTARHVIPSLRATGSTPSPPSARLIAFNLNAVGNRQFFPLAATGHPRNEPVTEIIVSHLWGAVQCTQLASDDPSHNVSIECTVTVMPNW